MKKRNAKKIVIISIIVGLILIGGFIFFGQKSNESLGASISKLNLSRENKDPITNDLWLDEGVPAKDPELTRGPKDPIAPKTTILRTELRDANWDGYPGTSPDFELEGTYQSSVKPNSIQVWFEYSTAINFPTNNRNIIDLNSFATIKNGKISVRKPGDANIIFNENTVYYGRFVVRDGRTNNYSKVSEFKTPLNCTVEIMPISVGSTVKKGTQTIAKMNIKNNCNKEITLSKVETGIFGLHLSNPDGVGRVSDLKIYTGKTLINSVAGKTNGNWLDFKNQKIGAGKSKEYYITAVVPGNVQANETLLTRVELRSYTMNDSYVSSINPRTVTSDGKIPSPVVDGQTYWQLKVVQ